jgi:hypothetical protein
VQTDSCGESTPSRIGWSPTEIPGRTQGARNTNCTGHELAGEYARALEGANSQERHAGAVLVAEAYEEICSLTQIELDLMVAAKVIRRSDLTERQMDIQDSIDDHEMFGLPEHYVQAATRWRNIAEFQKAIHLQEIRANQWRAEGVSRG